MAPLNWPDVGSGRKLRVLTVARRQLTGVRQQQGLPAVRRTCYSTARDRYCHSHGNGGQSDSIVDHVTRLVDVVAAIGIDRFGGGDPPPPKVHPLPGGG